MSYNPTTGIVSVTTESGTTYGVSVYDVQRALGDSHNDVGNLCKSNKINPYAKYKPVRSSSLSTPTDAQRKAINYGITAPVASSSPADTKNTAWIYSPPRGKGGGTNGADEWYRLLDFKDYCAKATSPIIGRGDLDISETGERVYPAVFSNAVGSMTFGDYGDLEDWYLCIYMVGSDSQHLPYVKTASAPLGENIAPSLSLVYSELEPFDTGSEYYLCLCDTKKEVFYDSSDPSSHGLPSGAKYLPLPYFRGDTLDNFIGTITKRQGYDITLSFNLVLGGNSAPSAAMFTSQSYPTPPTPNYFSALPTPTPVEDPDTGEISYIIENENRYYYNAGNNTSLKLRFQITGGTSTIYGNSIYAKLARTYYGAPTTKLKVDVYKLVNGTPTKINTSEALTQNTVYFGCLYNDVLVLGDNNQRAGAVPATLSTIRPYLELFDGAGENAVKIGGVTFGVCNQAF